MATEWISPTWRMPNEKNQSKFESYSLDFDGSNDYVDTGDAFTSLTSFSISAWFKSDDTVSTNQAIVSSRINSIGTSKGVDIFVKANELYARVYNNGATEVITAFTDTVSWHQVVITYNGTTLELFLDNVSQGTATGVYTNSAANWLIGKWNNGANYFDGSISEVTIFDYALSSTQVSSLYNSGSPINPMTLKPAPIAYYPLGGNASTGGDSTNTLSVPNIAVPDASVFDFATSDSISTKTLSEFGITNEFTISHWVKPSTLINYGLVGVATSSGSWNDGTGVYYDTNKWHFFVDLWNGSRVTSDTTATTGVWYHIVGTFSSSGTLKLYINGVEEGTPVTGTTLDGLNNTYVVSSGASMAGEQTNFQIWNKELTSSEVTTLYNNGLPLLTGAQPQETNLRGWYKLNQTANWEADAASTWQIPDAVSSYPQSFDFDGSNDWIDCGNAFTETGTFTISAWINTSSSAAASVLYKNGVFQFGKDNWYNGGAGTAPYLSITDSNGLTKTFRNGVAASGSTVTVGTFIDLKDGNWHNITFTYNGTNQGKYYTDGVLTYTYDITDGAWAGTLASNSNSLFIGKTTAASWNGKISNVQIWNTTLPATGTDSVETLYNNGVPLTTAIATDNLKAWYKLDNTDKWNSTTSNWSIYNNKYPIPTPTYTSAVRYNTGYYNLPGRYAGIGFTDTAFSGSHVSISVWYRWPEGYTSGSLEFMNTGSDPYIVFDGGSSGRRLFVGKYGQKYKNFTTDITDGNWHHYLLYFENTATIARSSMRLWQDGIEIIGSDAGSGSEPSALTIARGIGSANLGGGGVRPTFNVSNFALFNTDQTGNLSTLYNGGTPGDISSLNPLVWYKADSANVQLQSPGVNDVTFTDSSGNNNTGTGPFDNTPPPEVIVETTNVIAREAGTSSGMTEQNLVNNNVSVLNGESSGMDTSNLVTSTLTRQVPYNSYSLNFDSGNPDYILTSFAPASYTGFSVSAWVYADSLGSFNVVASQYRNGDPANSAWFLETIGSNMAFGVADGSSLAYATKAFSTGGWYHIVGVWNGSTAEVYIDGAASGSPVSISGMNTGTVDMAIGALWDTAGTSIGGGPWDGKISNISVFNQALTSTEVVKLYNSGVPGDLSSFNPTPVSWWSLGSDSYFNGSNWICPDLVGSNNGTSTNMDDDALIGDAPNSTANGTSTNMAIDANLTGSAPNSSNNSFSVNMDYTDRETSVPS